MPSFCDTYDIYWEYNQNMTRPFKLFAFHLSINYVLFVVSLSRFRVGNKITNVSRSIKRYTYECFNIKEKKWKMSSFYKCYSRKNLFMCKKYSYVIKIILLLLIFIRLFFRILFFVYEQISSSHSSCKIFVCNGGEWNV